MIYFNNDYAEGCHQKVLDALIRTNMVQTLGYGMNIVPRLLQRSRPFAAERMWRFTSWWGEPRPTLR